MLEVLRDLPPGVEGLEAVGRVSKEDYDEVFKPLLERARFDGHGIRFLYEFGPKFDGMTPSSMWEDAKIGLRSMRLFDACAIVSDSRWVRDSARVAAFLMPCAVRTFANDERAEALRWLGAFPERDKTFRLVSETGVIVVRVAPGMNVDDFDALVSMADSWIDAHGSLGGLVFHAQEGSDWESLREVLSHVQFARDQHRNAKRVALVGGDTSMTGTPDLRNQFGKAALKVFPYGELESAVAWAGS